MKTETELRKDFSRDCGMLATIFVVIKLNGVGAIAAWPWWAVLAPLWGGTVALVLIVWALRQ